MSKVRLPPAASSGRDGEFFPSLFTRTFIVRGRSALGTFSNVKLQYLFNALDKGNLGNAQTNGLSTGNSFSSQNEGPYFWLTFDG